MCRSHPRRRDPRLRHDCLHLRVLDAGPAKVSPPPLSKRGFRVPWIIFLCAAHAGELCIYRVSACPTRLPCRSTACTGKPTPASRRPRPSSPPESCPIRPCARRLSTWPPTPPRGLSTHLGRVRGSRGSGGRGAEVEGEKKKEGAYSS